MLSNPLGGKTQRITKLSGMIPLLSPQNLGRSFKSQDMIHHVLFSLCLQSWKCVPKCSLHQPLSLSVCDERISLVHSLHAHNEWEKILVAVSYWKTNQPTWSAVNCQTQLSSTVVLLPLCQHKALGKVERRSLLFGVTGIVLLAQQCWAFCL